MQNQNGLKPESDIIHEAISRLIVECASMTYNDTLTYETMEQAFGVKRYEGNWTYLVQKFRRRFQKIRGLVFRPVQNVGYRVCTQQEQAIDCMRQRKRRAARQIKRGIGEVECGSTNDLSPMMKAARAAGLEAARRERLDILRGLREQEETTRAATDPPWQAMRKMHEAG
jgi:hypothetical protein